MAAKRKIIWVHWRDASITYGNLLDRDVAAFDDITNVETVGQFVAENDEALILAIDRMPDQSKWRGIISIPKVNIVRRRVFRC